MAANFRDHITVDIIEDASGRFEAAPRMSDAAYRVAAFKVGHIIERHIKYAYLTGSTRWPYKANMFPCFLRDTGALSQAVMTIDAFVTPRQGRRKKSIGVHVMAPWPKNKAGIEYVWYHELQTKGIKVLKRFAGTFGQSEHFGGFGARSTPGMPKRSFIADGIRQAGPELSTYFTFPIAAIETTLKTPEAYGIKPRKYTSRGKGVGGKASGGGSVGAGSVTATATMEQHGTFNMMLSPAAYLTMLIPPIAPFSQLLLAWGASSDVKSALQGEMFNEGSIRNMVQAMAMGYFGATPRSQRRRMKRRTWGAVL